MAYEPDAEIDPAEISIRIRIVIRERGHRHHLDIHHQNPQHRHTTHSVQCMGFDRFDVWVQWERFALVIKECNQYAMIFWMRLLLISIDSRTSTIF